MLLLGASHGGGHSPQPFPPEYNMRVYEVTINVLAGGIEPPVECTRISCLVDTCGVGQCAFHFFLSFTALIALVYCFLLMSPRLQIHDPSITLFARDAAWFVDSFGEVIWTSAPHIYHSALPFTPAQSILSAMFLPHMGQHVRRGPFWAASWSCWPS